VTVIAVLRVFLGAGLLLSCEGEHSDISAPSRVASLVLQPFSARLELGETLQLRTVLRDSAGRILTDHSVTWATSNAEVARISPAGVVTALRHGSVTITAVADGKFATANVTVLVPVALVEITPQDPTIEVGKTIQLKATVRGEAGIQPTGRVVSWSSSNPAIASVSVGKVGGRRQGSALIEARAGDVRATTSVTVVPPTGGADEERPGT
jgi:uncharacterized protein YjdB